MTPTARRRIGVLSLAAPAIAFIALFLFVPVVTLLAGSFGASSQNTKTSAFAAALGPQSFGPQTLVTSLELSLVVTVITAIIGFPYALLLTRSRPLVRGVLTIALFVPLLTSEVVLAYGWLIVMGRNGVLTSGLRALGLVGPTTSLLYSTPAVIIGLVCLLLPFLVIPLSTSLSAINPEIYRASSILGARGIRVFRTVTLPITLPALLSGGVVVYALSMSAYAIPLVLGGSNVQTATMLVYTEFMTLFDRPTGSALTIALLLLVTIPTVVLTRVRGALDARR